MQIKRAGTITTVITNVSQNYINNYEFDEGEQLNIVGHSHGGNVGILVSRQTDRKIDNLVTLGTPARSDYQPNYDNIGNHVNVFSKNDQVQNHGGNKYTVSGLIGSLFGRPGSLIGNYLGWGEFGSAGRSFNNSANQDATNNEKLQNFGIITTHTQLWMQSSIWMNYVDSRVNR